MNHWDDNFNKLAVDFIPPHIGHMSYVFKEMHTTSILDSE